MSEVFSEIGDTGVATVTVNRPECRNALTEHTMSEFASAVHALHGDDNVRAVIVTGSGGAFCAGVDIDWLTAVPRAQILEQGIAFYERPQSMVRALIALPVPTIAALDGPAIGLGLDLALACDCRLIGPTGWLRQGWGGAGLIPATGGVATLAAVAPGSLWRLLDRQPRIDAEAAEQLRIGESAEPTAIAAAKRRAEVLAAMPPTAVRGYVELARAPLRAQLNSHLKRAAEIQLTLFGEGDYQKALRSKLSS
jgi:enoyl-CoA hydratase/carnithine racemase